jgi:hypothetical protein
MLRSVLTQRSNERGLDALKRAYIVACRLEGKVSRNLLRQHYLEDGAKHVAFPLISSQFISSCCVGTQSEKQA